MKRIIFLLATLAAVCGDAQALPASSNAAADYRILLIDPSSMPVGAGKATLIIGVLQRADGVYTGDYRIKVFPYFLKNETGRLVIVVSDKSLAAAKQGKVVAITGTATTSGKNGKCRPIEATATPAGSSHGKLRLWFMAGDRKMIFEPTYHFAGKVQAAIRAQPAATNLAAGLPGRPSISHPEALETAGQTL